ncbi:thiamine phosphate synthase [Caldanaerobius polysaccharolyticus]|nr:thiamine phosphate synthase [Caldanaerobius polysaccharolyticus]
MNKKEKLVYFMNPSIYCLTAESLSKGRDNISVVKEMLKAGVKIIQYREKKKSLKEKYYECMKIREMTKEYNAVFIVNDHVDLCAMVKADGIHIGQDDYPLTAVREYLGDDYIIGVSTHSPEQLRAAAAEGADYVGVGPIFETHTKEDVVAPVGFEYLEWAVKNSPVPIVAIGGIKEHNIKEVARRGAKCIALVSEIVGADDIMGKIKSLYTAINAKSLA